MKPITPAPRRFLAMLLLAGGLGLAGCRTTTVDPLTRDFPEGSLTMSETEARVRQLSYRMALRADQFATSGYRTASSSDERTIAAVFALRANEEINRALLAGYPLASLADLWTLNLQLQQFYASRDPARASTFGSFADESAAIAREAMGPAIAEDIAEKIGAWVEAHPIGEDYARDSVVPLVASIGIKPERGLGDISETVQAGLVRVSEQIEILQTQLPTVLTWQLTLVLEAHLRALEAEIPARAEAIRASLETTVATQVEAILAAVRAERIAIMEEVDAQRVAVMEEVDRQRAAIMRGVGDERAEVMRQVEQLAAQTLADVSVQRLDTLAEIQVMVEEMLVTVDTQRDLAVQDVDASLRSIVGDVMGDVARLALLLGGGAFVGLALLLILARVLWRRG